jgi:ribosomal-protein-alanine N-acetyltransferase
MMNIERNAFDKPWSASLMRDSLLAAHSRVWGIYEGEKSSLIAFGILSIMMDEAEIIDMAVDNAYQGNGYGRILAEFLCQKAKENGAVTIYLEVGVNKQKAFSLYRSIGFEILHQYSNRYVLEDGLYEDAIVMEKRLLNDDQSSFNRFYNS